MDLRPIACALAAVALLAGCGGAEETAERGATAPRSSEPAPTTTDEARSDGPVRTDGDEPRVETISSGLEVPWDVAFLPDGRALVTERPGRIRLVDADGGVRERPVARVEVQARGEGGLMGLALDPRFERGRPFAYAMATDDGEVRVLRLRWRDERLEEDGVVLDGIEAGEIHDSGRLRFGPDDRLYVVTGDAGQGERAQDRGSRNGKVLALDPEDLRGERATPSVVSVGHRNPQGLDWQPGTGQLFVTEHGPSGFDGPSGDDELNRVEQGGNFAWPRFGDDQPQSAAPAKLWRETIAPSGMSFVSEPGSAWTGDVLVAALKGTALHRLDVDEGGEVGDEEVLLDGRYGRLRAVVEAPDGALWVTTSNLDTYGERTSPADDRILRVVPPGD